MKLKVGGVYENGFGAAIKIAKAPNEKCRWFEDEWENRYHETGEAVQVHGVSRECNLVEAISEPAPPAPPAYSDRGNC